MLELVARADARLSADASRSFAYASAVALGTVLFAFTFSAAYALGTEPHWEYPTGDVSTNLIGWWHLSSEPWTFPFTVSKTIGPPSGFNVAFTDSFPLFALPAKLVRGLVPGFLKPAYENLYGPVLFVLWILQAVVVTRAVRSLGVVSRGGCLAAATLALTFPTFLYRHGHAALCAHFFVIWAVVLVVLARRERVTWRRAGEWVLLLALVSLTHVYLVAMCAGLFVAWCIVTLLHGEVRRAPVTLGTAAAGGGAVLLAFWAIGLLGERTTNTRAWGFGEISTNLLGVVAPRWSTFFGDRGKVLDGTGYQHEGYAYLGLGVIALFVLVLVRSRGRAITNALRKHWVLATALVVCFGFALSNRVFLGKTLLLSYDVPHALEFLTAQLRSSGRFVWPPLYAVLLFTILHVAKMPRYGTVALVSAAIVQVTDVSAQLRFEGRTANAHRHRVLDWTTWKPLIAAQRAVITSPSFECLEHLSPGADLLPWYSLHEINFLAGRYRKIVNSAPNPRPYADCAGEAARRETTNVEDATLYMFVRRVASGRALYNLESQGARCVNFEHGVACSRSLTDEWMTALGASAKKHSPTFDFSNRDDVDRYLGPGWSFTLGSTWTDGPRATVHLPFGGGQWLAVTARGVLPGIRSEQRVEVEIGGIRTEPLVYSASEDGEEFVTQLVPIPGERPAAGRYLTVDFVPRDIRGPSDVGPSEDTRHLGFEVKELRVVD